HLDAERHLFVQEQDTAYDVIKKKWASILSNVSLQKQRTFPSMQAESQVQADHPILFQGHHLCHLATEGKIKTLRLDTMKKACLSLGVEVTGSKARKDT
ncbi:unnamed protein product, partial [Porites lobata]